MIEVVHLITSLDVGGAQGMLAKLLERQEPARVHARVVSLVAGGAVAERLRQRGIEVVSLGMPRGVPDPRALLRLRRLLCAWRPAVLMTWLTHADLLGSLAGRWAGVPALVWNVRSSARAPAGGGALRVAARLCARLSSWPRLIVTNSNAGRTTHEALGYRPRAWRRIPNGFDLERFRPDPEARRRVRAELGLPEGVVVAGMLARFHPVKGHAALLQAGARLGRELSEPLHLVFAGEGASLANPEFAALVRASGAEAMTLALGERQDVPALMAALDLLVLPSVSEAFPNVLGEALACGVPCLASEVGDAAEIVGEAGLLFPAGNLAALTAGLARLGRMPRASRERLGRLGRARIERDYELGAIVRQYEELFEELALGETAP